MSLNLDVLNDTPRLLIEAHLKPLQGFRFQPTGFPDLGAAVYQAPDGRTHLLVESAQSMANRMEEICWDARACDVVEPLRGLPYFDVLRFNDREPIPDGALDEAARARRWLTCSLLEAHRLNSPYILDGKTVSGQPSIDEIVQEQVGEGDDVGHLDHAEIAAFLFKYDPNSLIHGAFMSKIGGGRMRLPRALSSFIEAHGAGPAYSGGLKRDDVDPSGSAIGEGAAKGYGHVPFQREEYTAEEIVAYWNLDLAQLRSYGLDAPCTQLLIALALFKVRALLAGGLRLRTACDLGLVQLKVTQPTGWTLPELPALKGALKELIAMATPRMADPARTTVFFPYDPEKAREEKAKKNKKKKKGEKS